MESQTGKPRRRRPRGEAPLYRVSRSDLWANETRRKIALTIATWLDQDGKAQQRVCDLTLREFEGIAEAAMAVYGAAREERWRAERALDDDIPY